MLTELTDASSRYVSLRSRMELFLQKKKPRVQALRVRVCHAHRAHLFLCVDDFGCDHVVDAAQQRCQQTKSHTHVSPSGQKRPIQHASQRADPARGTRRACPQAVKGSSNFAVPALRARLAQVVISVWAEGSVRRLTGRVSCTGPVSVFTRSGSVPNGAKE